MEDGCAYSNATGNACRCEWCSAGAQSLRPWIDEETSRVEISMVVYNAQYGSYTYVSVSHPNGTDGEVTDDHGRRSHGLGESTDLAKHR